jgi:hypothetical protein
MFSLVCCGFASVGLSSAFCHIWAATSVQNGVWFELFLKTDDDFSLADNLFIIHMDQSSFERTMQ